MVQLNGYQIFEPIYKGKKTLVYRGQRTSDQKPVILKLLRNKYPDFQEVSQFRNQYTISQALKLPGIVQTYSLERYQNSYALVMEDFGGVSLKATAFSASEESLIEFLLMAIALSAILNQLHYHRVIHKDIKPANILIHPTTRQVKLIDFSIASLLPRETQTLTNPNVLEGTLAYLSPEQTGRMNRGIDYRTDFYSLGVTFYELLTQQLPFVTHDPIELVYCHIAKAPAPAHKLNPEIPQGLSHILSKLMAKNAEDRYQSALGLKYDLEICLTQLQKTGRIETFDLGTRDFCDRFLIPEKLYGRQAEVETLLAACDRVAQGDTELLLVAGFSGIGKTAIVQEVHKSIVRRRGYFIKGKFDQFQRNVPFFAFVQAFRDLIGQLLTESQTQVEEWKTKILEAVGENGQVIIEVIPEAELLIGQQPAIDKLEPGAAQNLFHLVFQKFISIFPSVAHPLVLFVDDLQWADLASLQLIQRLMTQTEAHHLLLLGAYRDNEVTPTHPLMLMVDEVSKARLPLSILTLNPLSQADLSRLVSDTLNCREEAASPLTQLIFAKTKGNPFFSTQFLKALHEDGVITFDFGAGAWRWDLTKVRSLSLTNDVVEFMAMQLQRLPNSTQNALKLASCIGNEFDLATLAIVCEASPTKLAATLWEALQEGLIVRLKTGFSEHEDHRSYRFLHDRVRQAAYFLISPDQKSLTHLKIGRLLSNNSPLVDRENAEFERVDQLNLALDQITEPHDRIELAQLNLTAGKKAKTSTAYAAAVKYLTIGIQLLPAKCWKTHYDLTLDLYEAAAEAAYLTTDFEQTNAWVKILLAHAKTPLDRVKTYLVTIEAYKAQNQGSAALAIGLKGLKLFDIELPEHPTPQDISSALKSTQIALEDRDIEEIIDLPLMTRPKSLTVMNILSRLLPIAYINNPPLFPLLVLQQVNLSLRDGNCAASASAYVAYGITLWSILGDIDACYRWGELASNLLERFKAKELQCVVILATNEFTRPWKESLHKTSRALKEGYAIGLETGDVGNAALCAQGYAECQFWAGKPLRELESEIANYQAGISQLRQELASQLNVINWQTVLNLLGQSEDFCNLRGEACDEQVLLPLLKETHHEQAIFYLFLKKLYLNYLFQNYQQALQNITQVEAHLHAVPARIEIGIFYFYSSLTLLEVYSSAAPSEQLEILAKVSKQQARLKIWAEHSPMNLSHKYYLVEAKRHQVLDEYLRAIDEFDHAIELAKDHEYLNDESLCYETAARFYLNWGKELIAQAYLEKAYQGYDRWGAKAKLNQLAQDYSDLLTNVLIEPDKRTIAPLSHAAIGLTTTTNHTVSSTSVSQALDLATVLKASQALSEEIQLETLLFTLMQVVIENAGAETGVLMLCKEEGLVIEAQATRRRDNGEFEVTCLQSILVEASQEIPLTLIHYVSRTCETLVIDDATEKTTADPYILARLPKSVLCVPIQNQGQLIGVLYLENRLTTAAFTRDRLKMTTLLSTQVAISLKNAMLYKDLAAANDRLESYTHQLQNKVSERTLALHEKNQHLEQIIEELKSTQTQLIQSEKMSSLGQMVAGIAHEINNPINFIHGNLDHANGYIQDLLSLVEVYQQEYPASTAKINRKIEEVDLRFLSHDLVKLLGSMRVGSDRIRSIVLSLRNFSRLDESEVKPVDIHEGIDSTLMILQHRLKAKSSNFEIRVIQDYGQLPLVACYASQLNQVLMNILSNAIDVLHEDSKFSSSDSLKEGITQIPTIEICTELIKPKTIKIQISDNGSGMSKDTQKKIFDPFFTTKPVGKGTGLGLSISYQIIVKKHQGRLICHSSLGQGTTFVIEIPMSPPCLVR
ncbi:trifunctional serine/threonine-protein kinase/ATP-binding protein/sensor histidine kinase [Phormidesmis priestleyi]